MAKFGERLRLLRTSKGLSQQEFAKQLKLSKSSVNMYERCEREPGLETIEKIADYFNVDLDYLLGKSEFTSKYDWLNNASLSNIIPMPEIHRARVTMESVEQDVAQEQVASIARNALLECLEIEPNMQSTKRILIMLETVPTGINEILGALEINRDEFFDWVNHGAFPSKKTIDNILLFFKINARDLLSPDDYRKYLRLCPISKYFDPSLIRKENKIRIAGRDGSYEERTLTDEQLATVKAFLNLLPDASEDL